MDDDPPDRRQVARRAVRDAGAASAKLAQALLALPASAIPKLELDEDLRDEVMRARAVTSLIARRRAERTLAGQLRHVDLAALAAKLDNVRSTGVADPRRFHLAERWRTRLIEELAAVAEFEATFASADHTRLPSMIAAARSERDLGKPPGAGRALFRHVDGVLASADDAPVSDAPADDA